MAENRTVPAKTEQMNSLSIFQIQNQTKPNRIVFRINGLKLGITAPTNKYFDDIFMCGLNKGDLKRKVAREVNVYEREILRLTWKISSFSFLFLLDNLAELFAQHAVVLGPRQVAETPFE